MSDIINVVGNRLRSHRKLHRLSQEQVAEYAGLHPTYVGQVERGEKNLTIESLEKICDALNISFSTLFEGISVDEKKHDIPLKCYDIINSMNIKAQERTFRILKEIKDIHHNR